MSGPRLTEEVLIVVAIALGLYDLAIGLTCGSGSTISWQVWTWSQRYPVIPFGAGVLCGHLFTQMHGTGPRGKAI